ncbi:Importin subunit alpha-1 [Platanthera zijinensis]|uniref:Importin subunit alpha-1 n=1 Tax=Platanthera zijinensis TaxID=2320716 RepID=A0AAP0GD30_9ASPA
MRQRWWRCRRVWLAVGIGGGVDGSGSIGGGEERGVSSGGGVVAFVCQVKKGEKQNFVLFFVRVFSLLRLHPLLSLFPIFSDPPSDLKSASMSLRPSARAEVCRNKYKVEVDVEEGRRRREDNMVEIRKSKQE